MSCLFNSLSYFIKDISSDQLRKIICDYLLSNPKMMENIDARSITNWECDMSLESYVEKMKNTNVWGGGIEIKSFCEIFNLSVFVKLHSGKYIEFLPSSVNEKTECIQIYYTGNHYEPIKR